MKKHFIYFITGFVYRYEMDLRKIKSLLIEYIFNLNSFPTLVSGLFSFSILSLMACSYKTLAQESIKTKYTSKEYFEKNGKLKNNTNLYDISYNEELKAIEEKIRKKEEEYLYQLRKKGLRQTVNSKYKGAVNVQDSLALVKLYEVTDGKNWKKNSNWLTGNVSSWYGIKEVNDDGRVTVIHLHDNNLSGATWRKSCVLALWEVDLCL